jgi:hypothetical protein
MIISPMEGPVDTGLGGTQRPIIQNLGPGTLYVGSSPSNLINSGIKLVVNAAFEYPDTLVSGPGKVFIQADENDCDVRIQNVG